MSFLKKDSVAKPSFLPKYSDADILKAVIKTPLWQKLYQGDKGSSWILMKSIFLLKTEMFAAPGRTLLRYHFGRRSFGLIIIGMTALMMVAFNTVHWSGYLATFFPFAAPVIPFFMTGEEMYAASIIEVQSDYLTVFSAVYVGLSLIHLIITGFDPSGRIGSTSRGTSMLYVLVFKHFKLPQSWVQGVVEPLVLFLAGFAFWGGPEQVFGLFLMASGLCLFMQEFYNGISRYLIEI